MATGPRPRRRANALALGAVLLLGAASAAGYYLQSPDPSATATEAARPSESQPVLASPAPVRPELPPAVRTAPAPARPPAESGAAAPASAAGPPAASRPVLPVEPESSAGVTVDRCVVPTMPTMVVRGDEVLGALVAVKIDANSEPPRCLFVVQRQDGTLWVVDSSRAEARPQ